METPPESLATVARVQAAVLSVLNAIPAPACLRDLAVGLAERGLLVTQRTGLPVGVECADYLGSLRHSFLICQSAHRQGLPGVCVIVDPSFRDKFMIAALPAASQHATAVSALPKVFVGTINTVHRLTALLSSALAEEVRALGLELPPWRSRQALISNWLPRKFKDAVHSPRVAAAAAAGQLHPALLRASEQGHCDPSPSSSASSRSSSSNSSAHGWRTSRDGTATDGSAVSTTSFTSFSSSPCADVDAAAQAAFASPAPHRVVVKGFSMPALPPHVACAQQAPGSTTAPPAPAARSALTAQLAAVAAVAACSAPVSAPIAAAAAAASAARSAAAAAAAAAAARSAAAAAATASMPMPCPAQGGTPSASRSMFLNPAASRDDGGAGACGGRLEGDDDVHAVVAPPVHVQQSCDAPPMQAPADAPRMRPRVYKVKVAARQRLYGYVAAGKLHEQRPSMGPAVAC
ncbi:hypothetical protein TSOC_004915 [Tetrabaena socialis]|uniref:Uncharacterized protein n=1 Tax=Tetrabaena socialis TaxID=47790 RepID=A0A2J8A7R8_9CHLO|nr:hypothetical protein TSOC_004915 [Tetrabaena socialis]|eukprot:PNH08513.1 hypothetical protein TSOC_004915 [Tetrabaena socialis]